MSPVLLVWILAALSWALVEAFRFDRLQYRRLKRRMFSFSAEKWNLTGEERKVLRRFKLAFVLALLGVAVELLLVGVIEGICAYYFR